MKLKENSTLSIFDPLVLKLLTRLRSNFSPLNERKFRHNFRDTVNPMCCCDAGIEPTDHYLLHCLNFVLVRSSFLDRTFEINVEFSNMNDLVLASILLFGSEEQTFDVNSKILNLAIQLLKDTGRFDEPLI